MAEMAGAIGGHVEEAIAGKDLRGLRNRAYIRMRRRRELENPDWRKNSCVKQVGRNPGLCATVEVKSGARASIVVYLRYNMRPLWR